MTDEATGKECCDNCGDNVVPCVARRTKNGTFCTVTCERNFLRRKAEEGEKIVEVA